MVNTGKPSSGCATCKLRRKKCDEERPECRQCRSRGLKCPGIPKLADVVFRDETRKLKHAKHTSQTPVRSTPQRVKLEHLQNGKQLRPSSVHGGRQLMWLGAALPSALDVELDQSISSMDWKIDDAALSAFLMNCESSVKGPMVWQNTWHQIVMDKFSYSQDTKPRTFTSAMHAFCLHHVALMSQDRALLRLAAAYYGKALVEMGRAIKDPKKAMTDDTLLNGILMWAYESKASRTNIQGLDTHLDGAAVLLRHRERNPGATREEKLLLYATLEQLIYNYSRRLKPLPAIITSDDFLHPITRDDTPLTRLGMRAAKVPSLRARAKETFSNPRASETDYSGLLSEAIHIDATLSCWLEDLPSQLQGPFKCHASSSDSPNSTPQPRIYIYPSVPLAIFYSRYYLYRLYVSKILAKCQEQLGHTAGYHRTSAMISRLNEDLCATLPSAVGFRYYVSDAENLLKSIWPGEHANAFEDGIAVTNMLSAIRDANLDECFEDRHLENMFEATQCVQGLHMTEVQEEYALPREYRTPAEMPSSY